MKPQDAYKFCPRCGGSLKQINEVALQCSKCDKKLFLYPHPTTDVILEKGENEILVVKRASDPKKDSWDLPGGFIIPGETAEAAAIREIKEELGVSIQILDTVGTVAALDYTYEGIDEPHLIIIVRARLKGNETIKAQDDISEYKFVEKDSDIAKEFALDGPKLGLALYLEKYTLKTLE